LLAGCSGLDGLSGRGRDAIPSHELPDVADAGQSGPAIVDDLPVRIEQRELDERLYRVTELLETIPVPVDSEKLPNGVIRQRLTDSAHDATTYIHDARTAQTKFVALRSLRNARESARYAAAGWAYADSGRTKADLQREHSQAVSEGTELQANHEYLGADPVRAVLVHAEIERNLDRAVENRRPHVYESNALLTVAEWGEHVASTRALVEDTRYLYDRYTASLSDNVDSIEGTLTTAAEKLAVSIRNRRDELSPEPTEVDDELGVRVRWRLRNDAKSSVRYIDDADEPATALLTAVEGLTDFLAFERTHERIEEGESFRIENASDVRKTRERAIHAIRAALEETGRPELARPVLADAALAVTYADEELARYRGDVRRARLNDPLRRYITAIVRARSVPAACREVVDTLKA
jgi:hypothetical protein